ncbi:SPOR domain-containing protein [Porphyromonas sp.]|uniref:SPOR domain-containing protein n=1 Tax=Porphyromonas sp. TaxID=1924944 RepID=UPI0026DB7A3C|nr:SPOR domain-containing protein [Porphyromonas sp.]MDO4695340.1 SPOR domain-containing protein [Porphyromonas sp.]MDO4771100.1 SPOR domain-containing protein [Porphyromonas sp.]
MKRVLLLVSAVALVAGMTSCKPKQSAYRAAYERAKQQEVAQSATSQDEVMPVATEATRSERVQAAQGEDANKLRTFSVVIGSFQNITNAKSLKERMVAQGYHAFLAQNEKGMYRVILSSFDNKADAVKSRDAIRSLFSDAWILERAF